VIRPSALALLVLLCLPSGGAGLAADAAPQAIVEGQMLHGRFVQERHLAGFSKPLRSEGRFVLVPGRGLIWASEKPFDSTVVITPAGILQLVGGKEAMRLPASRLPVVARLYDILSWAMSGNAAALQRDFTVERGADAGGWHLMLRPAHSGDPGLGQLQSIALGGRTLVEEVAIRKEAGDEDRLAFAEQRVEPVRLTAEESALFDAAAR